MQMQELTQFHNKDKWWRNFMANMNIGMTSVQMKCRSSFMAKEKCCCSFITKMSIDEASWQRRMFMQLYGKDNWCGHVAKASVEAA